MRRFRVLHDFAGEEEVELSVGKGEVVEAIDNVVQDGWVKVVCAADPNRRGFVPLSYLEEEEAEAEAMRTPRRGQGSASQSPAARTPTPRSGQRSGAGERSLSDTALAYGETIAAAASASRGHSPQEQRRQSGATASPLGPSGGHRSATREGDTGGGVSLLDSAPPTPARVAAGGGSLVGDGGLLTNPGSVVEAFMKNEVYFKQLMRRRAEALGQLQADLDEAAAEVGACKDCNTALTRRLRELDQVVEKERRRWTSRLEEEKTFVGRSLSYSHHPSNGTPARSSSSRQPSPQSGARRGSGGAAFGSSPLAY